ncbi:unannotated protein [freshwater metagenome]|uniref:Unannotated protein n=1 Tax=freshwater metagenome TaxID=449393 RepID=A0A6J7NH34_9ZZZZ
MGFGSADDVRVGNDQHRHSCANANLADALVGKRCFHLPAGIGHNAYWQALQMHAPQRRGRFQNWVTP